MSVKLLTEHRLEFLSLKGGCTGSSESTLVKIPPCWKSHVAAHLSMNQRLCSRTVLGLFRKILSFVISVIFHFSFEDFFSKL